MMIGNIYRPADAVCAAGDSLASAARRMRELKVGALAMCAGERVIGVVSEHDVLRAVADGADLHAVTAGSYATWGQYQVDVAEDSEAVAGRMHDLDIRYLPVTSNGNVVGIVGIRDLLAVEAWV
jgi:CBS domain-containing protein